MTTTLIVNRRTELEAEIDDAIIGGRANMRRIGAAFAEIQDKGLFRPDYPTFEAYVVAVWKMSPNRAIEIAAGWKIADQGSKQTRAEDMPLYFHAYFANVVEDAERQVAGLTTEQRAAAATVARTIGTPRGRILQDTVEEYNATPEALATMTAEEQQDKLRAVNADMVRKFGQEQAAEIETEIRRKNARIVEKLNDDPAIGKYLRPGVEAALRGLVGICSPPE
jgi:hypothetical protein